MPNPGLSYVGLCSRWVIFMKKQNANKSSDTLTLAGISNAMAKLTLEEENSSSLPTEGNPTSLSMPKGETSSGIFFR